MRVFIAYSQPDHQIASRISSALRELGYEVVRADTFLEPGDDISKRIREELISSDALIILWSEHGRDSRNLMMELGFYVGAAGDRPILPVVLDDTPLPNDLEGHLYYRQERGDAEGIALNVASALSKLEGKRQQSKRVAAERKEEVERSAEVYIADSLQALSIRENKYQCRAMVCYTIGYLTILGGLGYAISRLIGAPPSFLDLPQAIYASVLTITAIGFVAAASRLAFSLRKSFMVESLRNNDRIHAIKFGEFYLKAFGGSANWEELKEAFQHWNLDTGSTFKDQSEDTVDPQVLKVLADLVKTIRK